MYPKHTTLKLIESKIFIFRGQKVLLSDDLADLYQVETKVLSQAVKRNLERFPQDFMFQLTWEETHALRSQIVTLKRGHHRKFRPYAFTEQGIAMLSSVLRSKRAVKVNIEIMRTFVRLRKMVFSYGKLARKIYEMEKRYDGQFKIVFNAIRESLLPSEKQKRRIGFHS